MQINHKLFFEGFKEHFDASLDQDQVDGIEFLLTSFESDAHWKDIRHIAYAFATIYHECAGSMQPVEEGYYLGGARVKRFQKTLRYYPYFGRGYVQLTWKTNYVRAGKALGIDFIAQPDLVMERDNSFQILTLGMFNAWFTKHKLQDHINGSKTDYVNARRIINGTDKSGLIAGYAKSFEKILKLSADAHQPKPQTDTSDQTNIESGGSNDPVSKPLVEGSPIENATSVETKQTTLVEPSGDTSTQTVTTAVTGEPVTVKAVAVGIWSKVVAGLGAITALGINAGTAIETKLSEISLNQVFIAALGIALLIVVIFYVKKRQEAADAKTALLIAAAADKSQNTIHLTK